MGCKESKDLRSRTLQINERWKLLKLPEWPANTFENDFEYLLFKTICLIRHDPTYFIPFVKNARDNKHYTGANIDLVITILKNMTSLPLLEVSSEGTEACRKVNDEMQDKEFPNCYRIRKVYRATF